jgi:hypothetical protein
VSLAIPRAAGRRGGRAAGFPTRRRRSGRRPPNLALRFRGGRHSLRATLAKLFYEKHKNTAKAQDLADALLVLEGRAADLEPSEVALRVGRNPEDGRIILDPAVRTNRIGERSMMSATA